jgi:hypothetical protein
MLYFVNASTIENFTRGPTVDLKYEIKILEFKRMLTLIDSSMRVPTLRNSQSYSVSSFNAIP